MCFESISDNVKADRKRQDQKFPIIIEEVWRCATPTQCVQMKLRWRFHVHASTCPEMYFWSWFWIIFGIPNTRPWLGITQKHIWNTIEDLSLKRVKQIQFKNTISSIMFQICFWANPSWDLVFEISKIIQNFDYK